MRPQRARLALLLAGILSACSPDPHAQRVVNIHNWADYIGKDTLAQFESETGIRVVYDTYDADETLEAKMMAGDSGYDIVSTSTDYFSRQIKAGIYQELVRTKLPGWQNLDPEVLAEEAAGDPGNRHAMPYLRHVNGFAYNVDLVKARMPDAPVDSLDMLFKPEIVAKFADCGVCRSRDPERPGGVPNCRGTLEVVPVHGSLSGAGTNQNAHVDPHQDGALARFSHVTLTNHRFERAQHRDRARQPVPHSPAVVARAVSGFQVH